MLCLDQRGDDLCDSLGHLRLGIVEVHPELRPFDPCHGGTIDQQQLRVSRHKNLQGEHHPDGDRLIPDNVAPAQRKVFDDSFTGNPVPTVAHRRECLESLPLPQDKPGHSVSLSLSITLVYKELLGWSRSIRPPSRASGGMQPLRTPVPFAPQQQGFVPSPQSLEWPTPAGYSSVVRVRSNRLHPADQDPTE